MLYKVIYGFSMTTRYCAYPRLLVFFRENGFVQIDQWEEVDIEKLKQSAFEKKLLVKEKKDRVFATFQDVVRHERNYTNVCGAWWDQLSTDQGELDKAKMMKDKAILQMWIHSVIECVFGRGRNTTGARAKEVIKESEGLDKEDVPAELIKALEAKAA